MATAGGLIFSATTRRVRRGRCRSPAARLWHFQANTLWKPSPMTYAFDGRQYIAVAAGSSIIAFAVVE